MCIIIKRHILLIITSLIVIKALTGLRTPTIMTHDALCAVIIIKNCSWVCVSTWQARHIRPTFYRLRSDSETFERRVPPCFEVLNSSLLMQEEKEEKNRWRVSRRTESQKEFLLSFLDQETIKESFILVSNDANRRGCRWAGMSKGRTRDTISTWRWMSLSEAFHFRSSSHPIRLLFCARSRLRSNSIEIKVMQ